MNNHEKKSLLGVWIVQYEQADECKNGRYNPSDDMVRFAVRRLFSQGESYINGVYQSPHPRNHVKILNPELKDNFFQAIIKN